ncbi:MAG: hypothetical protein AB1439_04160 [candidate division FCPU426 bacterium]
MKKAMTIFCAMTLAMTPLYVWAQGTQAQEQTDNKEKIKTFEKVTMEKKAGVSAASTNGSQAQTGENVIYIHDNAGNTINSFVVPAEIGLTEKTQRRVTTEYILNHPKTFMALYVADVRMVPPDYHYKTGYYSRQTYKVNLLDATGKVYFIKTVEGIPTYISENGKYIICFKGSPAILEGVSWEVKQKPPLSKITVLDQDGNVIKEIEENLIARNFSRISDNGEWLLFRSGANLDSYKIQNLKNHNKYDVGQIDYHVSRILDNGTIVIERYNQEKDEYYEVFRPLGK